MQLIMEIMYSPNSLQILSHMFRIVFTVGREQWLFMNQGELRSQCRDGCILWEIVCDRLEQNPSESRDVFVVF